MISFVFLFCYSAVPIYAKIIYSRTSTVTATRTVHYIDSCLNLPTRATFFCPQGPENDLENEDLKNYDLESDKLENDLENDDLFIFAFSFNH